MGILKQVNQEDQKKLIELAKNKQFSAIGKHIRENQGFNYNFTDEHGNTLLHFITENLTPAIHNGEALSVIQSLLILGLSSRAVNKQYKTPESYAIVKDNLPLLALMRGTNIFVDEE